MTDRIGVGVIGMGWMGEAHSRSMHALPDRFPAGPVPRLVACADPVEARATAAQRRFGFARSTTDWREVVDDPDVDVVTIAAPNVLHREVSLAALRAGKHVLCEKPVGRHPQDTIDIAAAAEDAGVCTFVGYNYRWAPVVQYAGDLLRQSRLGTITHYRGRFLNGYAADPDGVLSWRFEADQGLGTLGDLMVHAIDMALMLAGPIDRLVADRETFIRRRPLPSGQESHYEVGDADSPHGDVTNEDYVSALVSFASGARPAGVLSGDHRSEVRPGVRDPRHARRDALDLRAHERAADPRAHRAAGRGRLDDGAHRPCASVPPALQPRLGHRAGLRRPEGDRGPRVPAVRRHRHPARTGVRPGARGRAGAAGHHALVGHRALGGGCATTGVMTTGRPWTRRPRQEQSPRGRGGRW